MGKRGPAKGEGGRPPLYDDDEHPRLAREMSAKYKTQAEMAEVFGVRVATISEWKRDHPNFAYAIAQGKEDAHDHVERSLFERATGYTFDSEKIVVVSDGGQSGSHVERIPIKEHVPPDPTSIKYLLNNRRGKEWLEKQHTEHSGNVTMNTADLLREADERASK